MQSRSKLIVGSIAGVILLGIVFFNSLVFLLGSIISYGINDAITSYPNELRQEYARRGNTYLSYVDTPTCIKEGIISVEDKRFFTHPGFDVIAAFRAAFESMANDHIDHGGSTITQQLARRILHEKRNHANIFEEIASQLKILRYTLAIEQHFTKEKILELYLNNIYYGRGARGITQASRIYFNKNVQDLSLGQCVFLTGLPQAPTIFGNDPLGQAASERYAHVLRTMDRNHYLTSDQARALREKGLAGLDILP